MVSIAIMGNNKSIFTYDSVIRKTGISSFCGIDEAGRGPLAGPVTAAAVIFPPDICIEGLDDSKKLSAEKRELLEKDIKDKAVSFGIGLAGVEEIDQLNILQAAFLAMQRAVSNLTLRPEYLLVDGRDFPVFFYGEGKDPLSGKAVIKGDSKSASIAAASILAKVYRDRLMVKYADEYPGYGFEKHKGYGTLYHRKQIIKLGPCEIHRTKFIRNTIKNTGLFFEDCL